MVSKRSCALRRNKAYILSAKQAIAHSPDVRLSKTCWNSAGEGIAIAPITQFALTEY
ncbi:MAG: hypothetical protein V7K40_25090 [Nostoc sp.]|uniref:hypothetical protein n=1 Tax=Nostoc sp. TaxID=1180 RepID=UPI002FF50D7F